MNHALSPCTKICAIDPITRLCLGCHRTLAEIAQWSRLSDGERRAILMRLPARQARNAQA